MMKLPLVTLSAAFALWTNSHNTVSATSVSTLNYGDEIYLQNYDTQSSVGFWLVNEYESTDQEDVAQAVNVLNEIGQLGPLAKMTFSNSNNIADTDCIKYGDNVKISNGGKYLTGDSGGGNPSTFSPPSSYDAFIVRSVPGDGMPNDVDPAHGICVTQSSVVYFQEVEQDSMWLGIVKTSTTATDEAYSVYTWNMNNLNNLPPSDFFPRWIMSLDIGSNGSSDYGVLCAGAPGSATGSWTIISTCGNCTESVQYQVGTTSTTSTSVTSTDGWQNSITATVTAGFKFVDVSGSASVSASDQYSSSQSQSVSSAVANTKQVTENYSFPQGGVIWQFQYTVDDVCQPDDGFSVLVHSLRRTESADDYPCCLPGNFASTSTYTECEPDSPDLCAAANNGDRRARALLRGGRK
eukprot:CAMPEP_0113464232 /NCGR_PEP_ID=MMETSP0014_2-20120614/13091_1 /TAXON_ID=2857 /ORGANISM="Nitzschia sp." /LENGTH=407 /DNA_ID=CAMNT_0000356299 /DNA_START=395 /DNA_END=1618 /DNA_ORIENTATION=+ /assembly_acc=CAM_ASM_000159